MNPKTPSRQRARSEVQTPLTPSLRNAMNNMNIRSGAATGTSPPKRSTMRSTKASSGPLDTTNPFIASSQLPSGSKSRSASKSRPGSPVKRNTIPTNDSLVKQASNGVIRKGGVESRLDVVTNDYVPPAKAEMKRSKSTPAVVRMPSHVVSPCIPTYTLE